jgi:hypoxanthine phosphoribosyltransferase
MDILTLVFGVLGVLGTFGTFYYGFKYNKLTQQRYRFSWSDVVDGSQRISQKCIKRFKPEAILTFSGSGSIIANLALLYSGQYLPIYTVVEFPKGKEKPSEVMSGYVRIETSKWLLCVPTALTAHAGKKIAIIHDCAVSGTGLDAIIRGIVQLGFKREQIVVASLICTRAAIDANLSPDIYPYSVENSMFFFPWGGRV